MSMKTQSPQERARRVADLQKIHKKRALTLLEFAELKGSQEKAAREFPTSFVTYNNWVHGRKVPTSPMTIARFAVLGVQLPTRVAR